MSKEGILNVLKTAANLEQSWRDDIDIKIAVLQQSKRNLDESIARHLKRMQEIEKELGQDDKTPDSR